MNEVQFGNPHGLLRPRKNIKHDIAVGRIGNFSYEDPLHTRELHPLGKNPGDVLTWDEKDIEDRRKSIASRGDFWEINTQPFPEAHFAVFPEKLCEKPIKAGCPEEVCKKCGKAKEKIIKAEGGTIGKSWHDHKDDLQRGNRAINEAKGGHGYQRIFLGYVNCNCNAGFEPGIILDPFAGAGTALFVAKQLRRRFIGIDIKKEYCELAEKRLAQGVL